MNNQYEAVMILGRSLTEIDRFGWVCDMLGETSGPKCVNGVVTISAGFSHPTYLVAAHNVSTMEHLVEPLRIVGLALIDSAAHNILDKIRDEGVGYDPESLDSIGDFLVQINDANDDTDEYDDDGDRITVPLLNRAEARAWFNRAFELVAEELPEPLPALTVAEILAATPDCTGCVDATHGTLQHDGATCPVHEVVS